MASYQWIITKGMGQRTYLTQDYTTGWFTRKTLRASVVVVITGFYKGFLGRLTHVDVRDPGTGRYWNKIPINYFPKK